jgi:hypothetical protein
MSGTGRAIIRISAKAHTTKHMQQEKSRGRVAENTDKGPQTTQRTPQTIIDALSTKRRHGHQIIGRGNNDDLGCC